MKKSSREERIHHADNSDPDIFVVRLNKALNDFWDENELSILTAVFAEI